jgi:hypothetical protein
MVDTTLIHVTYILSSLLILPFAKIKKKESCSKPDEANKKLLSSN